MKTDVEKRDISKKAMVDMAESLLHYSSTILVAINGTKSSKLALKWALNSFLSEGKVHFKLFYVRPPITMIPTPMGVYLPISQVRDDIVSAYKKYIECQTHSMILSYKEICLRRKVDVEIVIREADDVAREIGKEVETFHICRIVIGASSRNMITRKLKGIEMSNKISESTPIFCTVFVIKKGKLSAVRTRTDEKSNSERNCVSSSCNSPVSFSESMDADTIQKSSHPQNIHLKILRVETLSTKGNKSDDTDSPCSILHSITSSNCEVDISALSESSFSGNKLGAGANGTVYKCTFLRTIAAVKILHSNEECGIEQFKQELESLTKIHHPHMLMLLGACPTRNCLVYEYMENGSLDDRLKCKNNTPPLPWYRRLRIAWEVVSALVFLHHSQPMPIVHRDLKPANILLDENFVSKIGDVGLSTLLPSMKSMVASPVGTFFYIGPEYQRTGLVSMKSDTYAMGMIILQLLTAKHPMGLAHTMEMAMEEGYLMKVLDPKAGQWLEGPAQELALLGLSCYELRPKDRPDLKDHVLPVLKKLKEIADDASHLASETPVLIPKY